MIPVHDGKVVVGGFLWNEVLIESRMIVRQTVRGIQETLQSKNEECIVVLEIAILEHSHFAEVYSNTVVLIRIHTLLARAKRRMYTHVLSIKESVILVLVECDESLKVLVLVQEGMAGGGGDLFGCVRVRRDATPNERDGCIRSVFIRW